MIVFLRGWGKQAGCFEIIFIFMLSPLEGCSWMNIVVIFILSKKPFDCSELPQLMISLGPGDNNNGLCYWTCKRFLTNYWNCTGTLWWPRYFLCLMDMPWFSVSETLQLSLNCQLITFLQHSIHSSLLFRPTDRLLLFTSFDFNYIFLPIYLCRNGYL